MNFQNFLVNPGPVIESLEVTRARELHQILVTGFIPGQEGEMKGGLLDAMSLFVKTRPRRDIGLHPENRFDAVAEGLFVKFDGAEKVAVVRHRQGRETKLRRLTHQFGNLGGGVEQAILRVAVKVNEVGMWHR